jgi:hypothetical protein
VSDSDRDDGCSVMKVDEVIFTSDEVNEGVEFIRSCWQFYFTFKQEPSPGMFTELLFLIL